MNFILRRKMITEI